MFRKIKDKHLHRDTTRWEEHSANLHSASWSSREISSLNEQDVNTSRKHLAIQRRSYQPLSRDFLYILCFCASVFCTCMCVCDTNLSRSSCRRSVCILCCSRRWMSQVSWRRFVHSRVSPRRTDLWLKHTHIQVIYWAYCIHVLRASKLSLTGFNRCHHITPILASLHWLPVRFRIDF